MSREDSTKKQKNFYAYPETLEKLEDVRKEKKRAGTELIAASLTFFLDSPPIVQEAIMEYYYLKCVQRNAPNPGRFDDEIQKLLNSFHIAVNDNNDPTKS